MVSGLMYAEVGGVTPMWSVPLCERCKTGRKLFSFGGSMWKPFTLPLKKKFGGLLRWHEGKACMEVSVCYMAVKGLSPDPLTFAACHPRLLLSCLTTLH